MKRRAFLAGLGGIIAAQRTFYLDVQDPVVTVRQPYLQNVRQDRATVMWATQSQGSGYVAYTSDGITYKRQFAQTRNFAPNDTFLPYPLTQYTAVLPRLKPNTSYSYYCMVDGVSVGAGGQFVTAGPGPFTFLAMGDSGMGTLAVDGGKAQTRIAALLSAEQAALLVHVGDIAYFHGNFAEFQRNHFDFYSDTMGRMPFFPTPGNHEYDTTGAVPYYAVHSFPTETVPLAEKGSYYSFDWGNVHFVSLDSNSFNYQAGQSLVGALGRALRFSGEMLNWLDRDLKSTRQYWKVVFFHHPPYAGGRNYGDFTEADVRNSILPILEANGVQLVLSGHEHSYQRTFSVRGGLVVPDGSGTVYMTLGGGGADLYPDMFRLQQTAFQLVTNHFMRVEVNGTSLTMNAINDRGVLFEKVKISPLPALSDSPNAPPVTFDSQPAAGALVKVRGRNLADQEVFSTPVMAATLAGTSLAIAGQPIPLVYVSPTQIVGQLPFAVAGTFPLTITTTNGTLNVSIKA